jgi:hypothetical protein
MGVRIMGAVGSALKVDTARRDLRDQMDPGSAARAIIAPQAPPMQLADPMGGCAARAIIAPQAPPLQLALPVACCATRAIIAPKAPPLQLATGSASRAIRIVRAVCGALQVDTARRDLRDQMDPGSAARAIIALKAPALRRSAARAIIALKAPALRRSAARAIIALKAPALRRSAARAMIALKAPALSRATGIASRALRIVRAVCGALKVDTARRDLRDQMDPGSAVRAIIAP